MSASASGAEEDSSYANADASYALDNSKPWDYFFQTKRGSNWQADEDVSECGQCSLKFDWFNRKHHCRRCGLIFCSSCCGTKSMLPIEFGVREPQRTCGSCSAELLPLQDELVRNAANATRTVEVADSKELSDVVPVSFSLTKEIAKATKIVRTFFGNHDDSSADDDWQRRFLKDDAIPAALLHNAKGLVFLTVFKGAFLFGAKTGTGLLIVRDSDRPTGWSAPSALATFGVGWGAQIGAQTTRFVLVLNTDSAVEAFSSGSAVNFGAELGFAIGPVGRSGEAMVSGNVEGDVGRHLAPVYTYSHSVGLFAGVSLEGAALVPRTDVNTRFYGRKLLVREILTICDPPQACAPLYAELNAVEGFEAENSTSI